MDLTQFHPLAQLAIDVAGIAFVVGVLFFLLKKVLPPKAREWLFEGRPWLVNIGVILLSVGVAFVGAWLNFYVFKARTNVEIAWKGLYSAAVCTLGYEFTKNLGRPMAATVRRVLRR